jgi:hypothetical protein
LPARRCLLILLLAGKAPCRVAPVTSTLGLTNTHLHAAYAAYAANTHNSQDSSLGQIMRVSIRLCFGLLVALQIAESAAGTDLTVRPGAWERRTVASILDADRGIYSTMSDNTDLVCLTKTYLDQDPYLTPAADRRRLERDGRCLTSGEQRHAESASWNMVCEMTDGTKFDMKIQNQVSHEALLLITHALVTNPGSTVEHKIRTEQTAKRIGPCKPNMSTPYP